MANWPLVFSYWSQGCCFVFVFFPFNLYLLGLKDFEIKSVKCYFSQSVSKLVSNMLGLQLVHICAQLQGWMCSSLRDALPSTSLVTTRSLTSFYLSLVSNQSGHTDL